MTQNPKQELDAEEAALRNCVDAMVDEHRTLVEFETLYADPAPPDLIERVDGLISGWDKLVIFHQQNYRELDNAICSLDELIGEARRRAARQARRAAARRTECGATIH
jgi:hypothetical protein